MPNKFKIVQPSYDKKTKCILRPILLSLSLSPSPTLPSVAGQCFWKMALYAQLVQ